MYKKFLTTLLELILGSFMCILIAYIPDGTEASEEKFGISSSGMAIKSADQRGENSKLNKGETHPSIKGTEDDLSFEARATVPREDYVAPYIDYDEVFLKDSEEEITTSRYSNYTSDGEIDWSIEGFRIFRVGRIQEDMISKLTIDGKNISIPRKFKDLGEEYAVFDKVDFSKIDRKNGFAFTITDKTTGNKVSSFITDEVPDQLVFLLDKEDRLIMRPTVEFDKNEVVGLYSTLAFITQLDLRMDEIGVGSTLNEMYDKLGLPSTVDDKCCTYYCENEDYSYVIIFGIEDISEEKMRHNVISGIIIRILEEKDGK